MSGAKHILDNPIPHKALGGNSGKKQHKLCQNCTKHSPKIKNTHNTSECHKWNPDGSPQNGKKQAHAQTSVPKQLMACFAQMQKDDMSLRKMLACTSRKGKRKSHRCSSHEDSASDGSNSKYSYQDDRSYDLRKIDKKSNSDNQISPKNYEHTIPKPTKVVDIKEMPWAQPKVKL